MRNAIDKLLYSIVQIQMIVRSWEFRGTSRRITISLFSWTEKDNEEKLSVVCSSSLRSVGVCYASSSKAEDIFTVFGRKYGWDGNLQQSDEETWCTLVSKWLGRLNCQDEHLRQKKG